MAANRPDLCLCDEAVNQPPAVRTQSAQKAAPSFAGDEVSNVIGRSFRRATAHAEHFAGATRLLLGLARLDEVAQVGPVNEKRSLPFNHGQAVVKPSRNGVLMHAQKRGGFRDAVAAMKFDAADVITPDHASLPAFDEGENVFGAPCRNAVAELYGFGETPVFNARPPSRARNRNRAIRRKDRS